MKADNLERLTRLLGSWKVRSRATAQQEALLVENISAMEDALQSLNMFEAVLAETKIGITALNRKLDRADRIGSPSLTAIRRSAKSLERRLETL